MITCVFSTTEPPDLAPSHPFRDAFARYGRYVAGHVITALLISAAVGTILIYPIPFLFTRDSMNGASNLPHHVWTAAQPLAYDASTEPDIIMRSVWVHSSYMEALQTDVLAAALKIQEELMGPMTNQGHSAVGSRQSQRQSSASYPIAERDAAHIKNGLTKQSWLFHSPLLYWNCSQATILADNDILATVNERKNMVTAANITLRHSIVFSGKRFEDRRLVAADAIVITLLYLRDSPVGREWERRALGLPKRFREEWDVYPSDGSASKSELYEFQFRPMSVHDILSLGLAYGLAVMYFLMSLSKLRAVKSKFGLIVTVVTQIAFSIMSSFTVCAVFNFDLSRIPHAAYPLVVLSMSLENIFRLINAAILSPSKENTSNRIGYAFGQTAHTALASSMQNVAILVTLSRMVSPGVSAFCIFAAVAIVFDFFYLSTFFLSVLSVDVRRMELGDALTKAAMRHSRHSHLPPTRSSWMDRALQGKIAMSTRIAGSIITIGFVIIAQWHFFGDDNMFRKVLRLYNGPSAARSLVNSEALLLKGLHQARSPTSWLRNQDHETAREVINAVKPTAYSYVARVFEPLIFVKRNSDRMPHTKEPTLLPAVYDFINHQLARFVVIVVTVIAALRLLMNFLLWEDDTELGNNGDGDETPILFIKSMKAGHVLDIALLFSLGDGRIVSIGLDRVVRLWDLRGPGSSYVVADGNDVGQCPFPILSVVSDSRLEWMALLSPSKISFWNLADRYWGESIPLDDFHGRPESIFFDEATDRGSQNIVMVFKNGTVVEVTSGAETGSRVTAVCSEILLSTHVMTQTGKLALLCDRCLYM